MKKTLTSFALTIFLGLGLMANVYAQRPKLGIGLTAGIPTSDEYFNIVLGADLRYQFDVSKQLSIPITTGYTFYHSGSPELSAVMLPNGEISSSNSRGGFGFIPLKAGAKYFFNPIGSGLYGLAEIGAAFGVTERAKTGFLYSPAIGYSWSSGIDLGLKYEAVSNANTYRDHNAGQIAMRIAYGFKL